MIGGPYALAAVAVLVATSLSFAGCEHQRAKAAKAELVAYKAEAAANSAKAEAKSAVVSEKVVVKYRDRIKEVRVVGPEVVREIEIIRESGCKLPREWVRLHDSATGQGPEAPGGADGSAEVSCAAAIEAVRENYQRSRENAAQLEALQAWAASVSE